MGKLANKSSVCIEVNSGSESKESRSLTLHPQHRFQPCAGFRKCTKPTAASKRPEPFIDWSSTWGGRSVPESWGFAGERGGGRPDKPWIRPNEGLIGLFGLPPPSQTLPPPQPP